MGVLFHIALSIWIVKNSKAPILKVAQPLFCLSYAISAGILNLYPIAHIGKRTNFLCMLEPWLFHVPFVFMFS